MLKDINIKVFTAFLLFFLIGCGGGSNNLPKLNTYYKPTPLTTWDWQLNVNSIKTHQNVLLYDIDLFDTPKEEIDKLHKMGKKVICYFSAGSYENWREDKDKFPKEALGNELDGWEGERWLDVRNKKVWEIMQNRIALAKEKGCDGVEPDNVDGYANDTGFNLSAQDQLNFNKFLASQAHKNNLSIALKNDLDQIQELINDFDFALNEQCHEFNECDKLMPFIKANKAVLNAEYDQKYKSDESAFTKLCEDAKKRKFSTVVFSRDLDGSFRKSCQ